MIFSSTFPLVCDGMLNEIENFEFVQDVNFDFIDLVKSRSTKNLLISDDSFEQIRHSNFFVSFATAVRLLAMGIISIKKKRVSIKYTMSSQ